MHSLPLSQTRIIIQRDIDTIDWSILMPSLCKLLRDSNSPLLSTVQALHTASRQRCCSFAKSELGVT